MHRTYFALLYRLDACERYLIWYGNDVDGLVTNNDGRIPSFPNLEALQAYAQSTEMKIKEEAPILHDLDGTVKWIETGTAATVDCDDLLAAWNLFADVSNSVAGDFESDKDKTAALYQRLFFGTGTANDVLRPKDEPIFRPRFSSAEVEAMRETLNSGLAMFRHAVLSLDSEGRTNA